MTQRDNKEIEKASRENFGKLFYDLAKTTYGAMVIGAIIGLFSTNSVDGKTISLLVVRILLTLFFITIGYYILKKK